MCEDSDTLILTFSDRFADALELLQTPWVDGREHTDHHSGIYFNLHMMSWASIVDTYNRLAARAKNSFRCGGSALVALNIDPTLTIG